MYECLLCERDMKKSILKWIDEFHIAVKNCNITTNIVAINCMIIHIVVVKNCNKIINIIVKT